MFLIYANKDQNFFRNVTNTAQIFKTAVAPILTIRCRNVLWITQFSQEPYFALYNVFLKYFYVIGIVWAWFVLQGIENRWFARIHINTRNYVAILNHLTTIYFLPTRPWICLLKRLSRLRLSTIFLSSFEISRVFCAFNRP